MMSHGGLRRCSKSGCSTAAISTLSYNYGEQVATLSPLQQYREPHNYDLCLEHSERLIVPRGWQVVTEALSREPVFHDDDFAAIADAVRGVAEVAKNSIDRIDRLDGIDGAEESVGMERRVTGEQAKPSQPDLRRRGHLRAL